jgi:hypothetical protein
MLSSYVALLSSKWVPPPLPLTPAPPRPALLAGRSQTAHSRAWQRCRTR